MNNNNFGNKPSFGNSPFSNRRETPSRASSFGAARPTGGAYSRPMGGTNRPMSFGSAYGNSRPGLSGSYGRQMGTGLTHPRPAFSGGYSTMYGKPSYLQNKTPFSSSYTSRYSPLTANRGSGNLPPFTQGNQNVSPQNVYNKYSLENAQPQGVEQNEVYDESVVQNHSYDPNFQEDTQVVDNQSYEQQPQGQEQSYEVQPQEVNNSNQLDVTFLKSWEDSLFSLAQLSSVGNKQRGSYIIDDIGGLIGEGYEGKQEDPNNIEAEVYDYASEINSINNSYSIGKSNEIFGSNVLTTDLPSEESINYLIQMGIKTIYFWTNGPKEFKKIGKNKDYKNILKLIENEKCKLIPIEGNKR